MKLAGVVIALAVTACTLPLPTSAPPSGVPDTTVPPMESSTPAGTPGTSGPGPADYEVVPCEPTPPVTFAVLCDAYGAIMDRHVDTPDTEALAASAVLGVADVPPGPEPEPPTGALRCAVPDDRFGRLCEAVSGRLVEEPASIDALMEGAVRGMFRYGLDPFSVYIPDSELGADFDPTGVVPQLGLTVGARDPAGAVCSPIGGDCRFRLLSVFRHGPADAAGLIVGDVVVRIDDVAVQGLAGEEAVARLAGDAGSPVRIVIERGGVESDRELVRDDVRFSPSEFRMLGDVAHIRLNDFSQEAAQDLGRVLGGDDVRSALGIVLDLRDNPGGFVAAAQAVASQFLAGGDVMVERGRDVEAAVPVLDGGLAVDGPPMVVLVNRGSASAAEIVAAVLQERGRAVVVGQPTFGKSFVQEVIPSRDGGQIRLTVARWETPGGLDIGITGLPPDIVVEASPDAATDPILEAGLGLLGG